MNYINILIGLVILLILSKIIRNTTEYFKCPNENDRLNKFFLLIYIVCLIV